MTQQPRKKSGIGSNLGGLLRRYSLQNQFTSHCGERGLWCCASRSRSTLFHLGRPSHLWYPGRRTFGWCCWAKDHPVDLWISMFFGIFWGCLSHGSTCQGCFYSILGYLGCSSCHQISSTSGICDFSRTRRSKRSCLKCSQDSRRSELFDCALSIGRFRWQLWARSCAHVLCKYFSLRDPGFCAAQQLDKLKFSSLRPWWLPKSCRISWLPDVLLTTEKWWEGWKDLGQKKGVLWFCCDWMAALLELFLFIIVKTWNPMDLTLFLSCQFFARCTRFRGICDRTFQDLHAQKLEAIGIQDWKHLIKLCKSMAKPTARNEEVHPEIFPNPCGRAIEPWGEW